MTSMTSNLSHSAWADAIVASTADTYVAQYSRPVANDQPGPAAKPPMEDEAERWVEQMMFERYNGQGN